MRFPTKKHKEKIHAGILLFYLRLSSIDFKKDEDGFPVLEGERYRVHGMGKAKVNVEQKQASFYGGSMDYGIGIHSEHLDSIRKLAPDWNIKLGKD